MTEFNNPFEYKVIYVFSIAQQSHAGLLKIGDTTLKTATAINKLFPNSSELKRAAKERIDSYTQTAGIAYNLLYTDLAIKTSEKNGEKITQSFRDFDVRRVLKNSGYMQAEIDGSTGREWVKADIDSVIDAIDAVKINKKFIKNARSQDEDFTPIDFRPEQRDAIAKTVKRLKKHNKMLWNAKMRFGKTVCALQVIKEMNFAKTIIITHRPVVNDGWREDFDKIFYDKKDDFIYASKSLGISIEDLEKTCKNYVYFMSVQDLRGSEKVGGTFDKNDEVFNIDWDFVIVDEAHEGTTTELGQKVTAKLVKENTKKLELSGTPFNIVDKFNDEELYTWDYVMEQKAKTTWGEKNFGDGNPYDSLPKLNIFTYNLGNLVGKGEYQEIEDKAFNFREFFKTWTGNAEQDCMPLPHNARIGDFVHEQDVISFLNLITKENAQNNYPYASKENRELFQHALWMLPGVKEAKALSALLDSHSIFGSGQFDIINVAGDGDDNEEESKEALQKVKEGIAKASKLGNSTITLSCGKLTTGVTIPEWTAVMMLSGSYATSASNYLQTIFRVQSPANINGQIKTNCYVFDFAPDRTLKMVADAVNLSAKAGNTSDQGRIAMGQFLNFCPVIAIDGTLMQKYDENKLLQQLKRAYADRAVQNGFDDTGIYSDIELRKLTQQDISLFDKLKGITGGTKGSKDRKSDLVINNQGLTDEQHEQLRQAQKEKRQLTPDEQKIKEEIDLIKKNKQTAISILRAISIRIPLLIYGAEVDFDKDITAKELPDLVDDNSWQEFMPTGVTKELFKDFIKYYDTDVFIAAGRKIKEIIKYADTLTPTERIQKITDLFKGFKNPDKETVLTPWRVVNMHMADCLGGYSFFNETYENTIEEPCFADRGEVTKDTLANINAKILEINSKTGLYPLYVAYSIFRTRCNDIKHTPSDTQNELWQKTVQENVFVICKTPMAKAITKRTLVGFNDTKINAHYFDNLINMLKEKPQNFIEKVLNPDYWGQKGSEKMTFNAVVGNPPYQISDGGNKASATPIYQLFVSNSKKLSANYLSMITPSRYFAGGKGLDEFREEMLNDRRIVKIVDFVNAKDCFPDSSIGGGINYFLWAEGTNQDCEFISILGNTGSSAKRILNEFDIFVRHNQAIQIIHKTRNISKSYLNEIITSRNPFDLPTSVRGKATKDKNNTVQVHSSKGIGFINLDFIKSNNSLIMQYKVMISRIMYEHAGEPDKDGAMRVLSRIEVLKENEVCTDSYLIAGDYETINEALKLQSYLKTKFVRLLLAQTMTSINLSKDRFKFVPLQDFSEQSDIDWKKSIAEIDRQLYNKYMLTEDEIAFIEKMIKPME